MSGNVEDTLPLRDTETDTDFIALISENIQDIIRFLHKVEEAARQFELHINATRIESLIINLQRQV